MSEKEKSWLEGGWNEGAGVGGGHDAQALTWPTTCVTVIVGQMGDMGRHGKISILCGGQTRSVVL